MATSNAQPNQFSLTGFVAVDATVRAFDKSAVARFPMSLSHRETRGEETVRKSSLINCEVWSNSIESKRFALLRKGQLIVINGFIKPEEYIDRQGVKQNRITFVCKSVAVPTTDKGKSSAKSATMPEPIAETADAPF